MATMAADSVFVDTNVLVYATRPLSAQHAVAERALTRLGNEGSPLWVSPQVLREYLAAVTRPQATAPALPIATAIADVCRFVRCFRWRKNGRGCSTASCKSSRPIAPPAVRCTTPTSLQRCLITTCSAC
jgi:predicted nucleic acid-binding protein